MKEGEKLRIKKQIENIDYEQTKAFFKNRAGRFSENNPYSVTMYQDNNAELVKERNQKEVEKLMPFMQINESSKVLDIACGIGRWADALPENITEYCGIDFSGELIEIANQRNHKENFFFIEGKSTDLEKILKCNKKGKYNAVLLIGILMYINDMDIMDLLTQIEHVSEEKTIIIIREPVGIDERLTLKNFFSEELKDSYNAIYRSREEILYFLKTAFQDKGFTILKEGFLFDDEELNNRRETAQYYYVLIRE